MRSRSSLRRHAGLALVSLLFAAFPATLAQKAGSIVEAGDTKVSAMMMFVGNEDKVYILDKAESNAERINGHPAWGSVWDVNDHSTTLLDITTNVFCASGMHLPNGSFITLGGNAAVGALGAIGSVNNGWEGSYDDVIGDFDGRKAIAVMSPCSGDAGSWNQDCQWYHDAAVLAMQKNRWYSAAEPLADGTVAIIGGFVNGGYINRNYPNTDPAYEGGAAEPTYEFYPSLGEAEVMQFMIDTSGLNSYALTYLMASGQMLVQANVSTMLWEPRTNRETRLDDMPDGIVRVYPASGANAMLPLTPENNYTQTILFCGGTDMKDDQWGDYSFPAINTWEYPASKDCRRLTPEPADGSRPAYEKDDDMLEGRTMGQFIALPDGTMLVVNGGSNGTAGYAQATGETKSFGDMGFGESLASDPAFTPAIYDPRKPAGQRWSNAGLDASSIPRLYHSSAILLPDGSVLIAGSNPNVDVNTSTIFPTTYKAEIFYPPYWSSSRPQPSGVPKTLSYGGDYFDITIPASSYSGSANSAAANSSVWVLRQGFTTHAMNMGQRSMQLNNTYTVNDDGSITLHVSQLPPNANLYQPGPAFIFVNVNGIPSKGSYAIIGTGDFGVQPVAAQASLPEPKQLATDVNGNGSSSSNSSDDDNKSTSHTGAIIGGIVGAVVLIGLLGAAIGICMKTRRQKSSAQLSSPSSSALNTSQPSSMPGQLRPPMGAPGMLQHRDSDATTAPLNGDLGGS